MDDNNSPLQRLRYHVSGAIERGEKQPIIGMPVIMLDKIADVMMLETAFHMSGYTSRLQFLEDMRRLLT